MEAAYLLDIRVGELEALQEARHGIKLRHMCQHVRAMPERFQIAMPFDARRPRWQR